MVPRLQDHSETDGKVTGFSVYQKTQMLNAAGEAEDVLSRVRFKTADGGVICALMHTHAAEMQKAVRRKDVARRRMHLRPSPPAREAHTAPARLTDVAVVEEEEEEEVDEEEGEEHEGQGGQAQLGAGESDGVPDATPADVGIEVGHMHQASAATADNGTSGPEFVAMEKFEPSSGEDFEVTAGDSVHLAAILRQSAWATTNADCVEQHIDGHFAAVAAKRLR